MGSHINGMSLATPSKVGRTWWIIDADGVVMGRLASRIALILRGKTKAYYTPYINCGDHVIVINAKKVLVTGNKMDQKKFFWHTGHPGGIKERKWREILAGKHPERLLIKAVERMMPKDSPLARQQMKSLYVYPEESYPHGGQNPQKLVITK